MDNLRYLRCDIFVYSTKGRVYDAQPHAAKDGD